MKSRKLGNIEVSPVGMGCMGLSHGYGEIPPEEYSIAAIRKAYAFGCTFFDTAEAYGPNMLPENRGHNERILGRAVQPFRREVVLATKFHLITEEAREAGVSQTVRSHLAKSLERLQTDYVDLYYLHRLNRDVPVAEVAEAMGQLIREGLIRGWGLSQVSAATIAEAHQVCPLAAVQNIYSLVERSIEQEVIPCCLERGIGVVPFSPVASGFLSGRVTAETDFSHSDDVRKFVPQLKAENIRANQPLLELIRRFADARGATMAQISLAWMLHKYPHVVPIPGSKNQERIPENLGSWNVELSDQEFAELESCLSRIPVAGFRGHVEMQGGTMKDWGRKPENS